MTTRSLPVSQAVPTFAQRGTRWIDWLRCILHAIESRHQLAEMDRRMLTDIGISRSAALEEAARAPWDLTAPRR